jgi:hypothetical protein
MLKLCTNQNFGLRATPWTPHVIIIIFDVYYIKKKKCMLNYKLNNFYKIILIREYKTFVIYCSCFVSKLY